MSETYESRDEAWLTRDAERRETATNHRRMKIGALFGQHQAALARIKLECDALKVHQSEAFADIESFLHDIRANMERAADETER